MNKHRPAWLNWAQLVRLPNVFTALSDVLAGMVVAATCWADFRIAIPLLFCIVALYWAGMILNDLFDVEKDRLQARGRPLVDGRISLLQARIVGYSFLIFGPVATFGLLLIDRNSWPTILVSISLATFVYLYNGPLKPTWLGPVLMGLCRVCSMLLGLSLAWWVPPVAPFAAAHIWLIAIGHGIYVMGLTIAARREAETTPVAYLYSGWGICLIGLAMLATATTFVPPSIKLRLDPYQVYPFALAILAAPWAMRAWQSIRDPQPKAIQTAVKQAILSIIFFDALLALQFGGTIQAVCIALFIFPAQFLGRWIRST